MNGVLLSVSSQIAITSFVSLSLWMLGNLFFTKLMISMSVKEYFFKHQSIGLFILIPYLINLPIQQRIFTKVVSP